jgi:hypothetical protein
MIIMGLYIKMPGREAAWQGISCDDGRGHSSEITGSYPQALSVRLWQQRQKILDREMLKKL